MSSSREVTAQKKKDVWEDVGSEFYQESYPSGSKPPSSTHQRRTSRMGLPLPSHTARRGSLLHGKNGRHYKSGARRKGGLGLTANRAVAVNTTTGLTYTSTMAADANGTTNANDIQVAILPDLSEETILNERKTWEELHRIKSMPMPMAQKKQLKNQLALLPKLRLKGWSNLKWTCVKMWNSLCAMASRQNRTLVLLNNSLKSVELRGGPAIVNVFLFLKWTIFLNLGMSLALITFLIAPYVTYQVLSEVDETNRTTVNPLTCTQNNEGDHLQLNDSAVLARFTGCCRAKFEAELESLDMGKGSRGAVNFILHQIGMGSLERYPLSYSYYTEPFIHLEELRILYRFDVAYVLVAVGIFFTCLILKLKIVAIGVREIIHLREGEFYKYSNLVFSGWEHYTNDAKGADFKRRVLRNEMKIALLSEKKKLSDLMLTKRQKAKRFIVRVFVNGMVIALTVAAAAVIFCTTLELTNEGQQEEKTPLKVVQGFVPAILIIVFNLIFPIILAKLGKFERYSREWASILLLLRALFLRLFCVFTVVVVLYRYTYCTPKPGHCTQCSIAIVHPGGEVGKDRLLCWESLFADQVYRLILLDLALKIVLTFLIDPIRRLMGYCCGKTKFGKRVGTIPFNIVRHTLDIIWIQNLSWMSFYFAPFVPILAVIYCLLLFYLKKFSLLYNCKVVPDTFRTTRSTGMFMAAKIISFLVALTTFGFVVGFMVPSAECGPFRGKTSAWEAVSTQLMKSVPEAWEIFGKAVSPGVFITIAVLLILLTYYFYTVAQANRSMVETLRHLLILEGHDKQYLFAKLNSLRRKSQSNSPTIDDNPTLHNP